MSEKTPWLKKPANAAAAGAAVALTMAMFTPAAVLLAVGGAIAGAAYMLRKPDDGNKTESDILKECGIDEPANGQEEEA